MARRKLLKGIAGGIAGSFASRNNDTNGYWTLGILCQIATDSETNQFYLDLVTGDSKSKCEYSKQLAAPYYNSIIRQIANLGFTNEVIKSAIIQVEFSVQTISQVAPELLQGNPFICRTIIVDDLNQLWSAEVNGWCRPHDPKRERRSTR